MVRKSRCCYLKSTLLAEKYTFLTVTTGYYPQKTHGYPKKEVITKKSRLSQKKKYHIVIRKITGLPKKSTLLPNLLAFLWKNQRLLSLNQTLLPKIKDQQSKKKTLFAKIPHCCLKCEVIPTGGKRYYLKQPLVYLKQPQFYLKQGIIPKKIRHCLK